MLSDAQVEFRKAIIYTALAIIIALPLVFLVLVAKTDYFYVHDRSLLEAAKTNYGLEMDRQGQERQQVFAAMSRNFGVLFFVYILIVLIIYSSIKFVILHVYEGDRDKRKEMKEKAEVREMRFSVNRQ